MILVAAKELAKAEKLLANTVEKIDAFVAKATAKAAEKAQSKLVAAQARVTTAKAALAKLVG